MAAGQESTQRPVPPAREDPPSDAPLAARSRPSPVLSGTRATTEKASRVRQTIARRTRESLLSSAQLTQVFEVDFTRVARVRDQAKASFLAREGVKLTFLPFLAKAAVEALGQHPALNAYLHEEIKEITYFDQVGLAVAVDTDKGLLSPVVPDAGRMNLAGLARAIADIATRTRTGQVTPDELSGGTFTVTNLGSNGALFDTPIINQPQSAILGLGSLVRRPVVATGPEGQETIAIRTMALPRIDLRPSPHRWRGRGPIPDHAQAAPTRGAIPRRTRLVVTSHGRRFHPFGAIERDRIRAARRSVPFARPSVWANIAVRLVVYTFAAVLIVSFQRGRRRARTAPTVLLTVIGPASLVVPAVLAMAAGQTVARALSDGGELGWAFIAVRLTHICCVVAASVLMFTTSANRYFAVDRHNWAIAVGADAR